MQYNVSFSSEDGVEFVDLLSRLVAIMKDPRMHLEDSDAAATPASVAPPPADKPKGGRGRKADKADQEPVATPTPKDTPAQASMLEEPPADGIDYTRDIRPLLVRLLKADRQACARVLGKMGVENAQKVKPEDYPAFMQILEAEVTRAEGEEAGSDDDEGVL